MDSAEVNTTSLEGVLNALEIDRKKIASTYTYCYILFGLAVLIGVVGLLLGFAEVAIVAGVIPGIVGGVWFYLMEDDVKKYKTTFKTNVLATALKKINESLSIEPQNGLSENEFISSDLFATEPDRYNTQDLISGKVAKTSFWFAEVHAEYKTETQTKNGRKTQWHTIFKGIIFVADFNKKFNVSTVVRPKSFGNAVGAWFSKNIFSPGNNQLVQLENTAFDDQFVTYTRNQIEARYILTPAMMERILNLNSKSAETISLSFIDSKMYIAFPLSTNYFEPPIHNTLLTPNLLTEDLSVVQFMHDIVQDLDLNTRIWGKE